jgi:hypothetical protein
MLSGVISCHFVSFRVISCHFDTDEEINVEDLWGANFQIPGWKVHVRNICTMDTQSDLHKREVCDK